MSAWTNFNLWFDLLPRQSKLGRRTQVQLRRTFLVTAAAVTAVTISLTSPGHAGWFDDNVTHPIGHAAANLGKAAGEVVSLGEIGRQRDRERAEAAEREARIQAEAAQRQRTDRINSTKDQIATLERITAALASNKSLAEEAWTLHDKIVTAGQSELVARARATADEERTADSLRKSREELAGLNNALTSLNYLDGQLEKTSSAQQEVAVEGTQAIEVARQLLRTADLDAASGGLYLDRAVRTLKTDNLKDLITTSIEARSLLAGLRSNLAEQMRTYSDQLAGKKNELASL